MRDNIEKDFAHVLSNRGVIARISNVKYAFEMKKVSIWIHFPADGSYSAANRRIERKSLDDSKFVAG